MPAATATFTDQATGLSASRTSSFLVRRVGAAVGKVPGTDPAVSAFAARVGGRLDVRRYYCATTLPAVSTFAADTAAGRLVSLDFKPSTAVTVAQWAAWLMACKQAGHMMRISLWHEPADDMSAAAYIALTTPYVPAIRAAGYRHQWCVTNFSFIHSGGAAWYPGDGLVDDVCPDFYPQASAPGSGGDTLFAVQAFADLHDKPLGVLEFSGSPVSGATDEAVGLALFAHVQAVFTARLASNRRVAELLYFNSGSNNLANQPPSFTQAYMRLRDAVS